MYFKNHHHIYFKCLSKQKIYDEKLAIRETFKAEKELITYRKKLKQLLKMIENPKKAKIQIIDWNKSDKKIMEDLKQYALSENEEKKMNPYIPKFSNHWELIPSLQLHMKCFAH